MLNGLTHMSEMAASPMYDKNSILQNKKAIITLIGLVCCFTSQSTIMVISRWLVNLIILFPAIYQYLLHILSRVTDTNPS